MGFNNPFINLTRRKVGNFYCNLYWVNLIFQSSSIFSLRGWMYNFCLSGCSTQSSSQGISIDTFQGPKKLQPNQAKHHPSLKLGTKTHLNKTCYCNANYFCFMAWAHQYVSFPSKYCLQLWTWSKQICCSFQWSGSWRYWSFQDRNLHTWDCQGLLFGSKPPTVLCDHKFQGSHHCPL